ncbi:MAG: AMP-binding protein [Deltaproteobacteria bacterium]|nr:AMP-binding protein [Deltaproteobacteria bacterium]MBW2046135.1 AMP-binding protein [Deltaproteobacteria bacterium]MBW2299071.1 AMP-binding protein [Deltaproteobacteria bacterium]RLB33356.1 MAG: long-chain fatty acid--CoA ligase [Deltaproteobacteria bacterium]
MLIGEILARNARMYGDEIALIEREPAKDLRRSITWKEFDETANRVANALIRRGVKKGDKVILLMMNCLEWLPIYIGILRTGAWAVPLNFRFTAEDICYCADIAEAKVMVFGEEFIDRVSAIKDDLRSVKDYIFQGPETLKPEYAASCEELCSKASTDEPKVPISILDEAGLYFTSGTTGAPKPILLTHRNLEFACIVENRHHNQTHQDNFLCIPPLYHTGAKMHWFGNFIVGAKAVILKGVKPEWIIQAVSEEQVTIVWLLVPWAQDILVAIENGDISLKDYKLDQWRLMHIGAQPVPPSLIKNWKKVFPNHDYDTDYGLSESTGPGCVHLGMENLHKVGAIGLPGFDWECRIVDDQLRDVPKGETGELAVKGPGVMKEYYKNPEATRKTIVDGWLLTGDMARFDEHGFIWLVDRKKDIIITGGENIFPVEIEDFLLENDKIQDAAVIGIPDERLGEIVAAIVKLKPGKEMSEDEFFAYCEALPRYKRPKKLFFDDVPRNPTGKIEKPKLRKKYARA